MIIFGDNKNVELIYTGNEINNIKKKCNITKNPLWSNNITSCYVKENKRYYLHNSDNYLLLAKVLDHYMAEYKIVKAPKTLQWLIYFGRCKFKHKKLNNWINSMKIYNNVNKNIFKDYPIEVINTLKQMSLHIPSWLMKDNRVEMTPFKSRKFDIYERNDLYDIVRETYKSHYLDLLLNKHSEDENVLSTSFNNLTDLNKLNAAMEKLYVETINQYIIPELELYNRFPKDLFECFMNTYMNVCSQYINYEFSKFLTDNYENIVNKYNEKIFTIIFKNALKDLEKI